MLTVDYEILPHIETCLNLQAFFLTAMWIFLLFVWISSRKKYPHDTLNGGTPSGFHWLASAIAGALSLTASTYYLEHAYWFLGFSISFGVMMAVLNPAFAVCFSLSMILMRPWEILVNNEFMLEIPRFSIFFSSAWLFFYLVAVDRFKMSINKVFLMLCGYVLWVFLSTIITPNPAQSAAYANETITRSFILFILIYWLIRDRFSAWALKVTLIFIFSCVGVIAIYFYLQKYTDGGRIIAFGLFKNTNDVAAVMTILLPLAASPWLNGNKNILTTLLAIPVICIALAVIALAQSRAAILSLLCTSCVCLIVRMRRKMMASLIVIMVLLLGYTSMKLIKRADTDLEGSSASRKSFMISGIRMAIYNPLLGVGYGQFPDNYEKYATEISYEYGKRTAHSSWVLALAETGPIGLALFLMFYFRGAIISSLKLMTQDASWFYAIIAYTIAMSFLSHTYMLFPYIISACVLATFRSAYRKAAY